MPLDWAATQNNLGNALQTLGAREDGTERLEQAVTAYNAALEVRTREQVPLDWAMTQNNLGDALATLGAREDGTERLEQAVTAYNAALEVRTREQVPLDWAMTQNNLGDALVFLGNRESRTGSLELAANAYRAALEVFTPEHMNWATTQRKLMLVEETIENPLTNPTTSERGIAASRNKLGFALQLCVPRYPGRLLTPGEFVPPAVVDFIGRQLNLDGLLVRRSPLRGALPTFALRGADHAAGLPRCSGRVSDRTA